LPLETETFDDDSELKEFCLTFDFLKLI